MKGILKIIFGLLVIFCFTENVKAGSLDKGVEALNMHDYFKAKQLFYKALKKDSAFAAYGLSVIYGRNNNPFYSLDSALLYVKIAVVAFNNTSKKKGKSMLN